MTRPTVILGALLLASEILYVGVARHDAVSGAASVAQFLAWLLALFACYGGACWLVTRRGAASATRDSRPLLILIALGSIVFRLTMATAGLAGEPFPSARLEAARADLTGERLGFERYLVYDDDVWRYLWDGHVLAHGENPYRFAPDDPRVDRFAESDDGTLVDAVRIWPDIRANINHPSVPTIYPPLAQALFVAAHAAAPGSVLAWKAAIIIVDLIAVLLVALTLRACGRPSVLVLLYAWNPLVIKVFAGSGHADALVAASLAGCAWFVARGARTSAGAFFGLAVLAKLSPVVLFPFVLRRVGWPGSIAAAAVVIGGYLPFVGAGRDLWQGVSTFSMHWQFNAGLYAMFAWVGSHVSNDGALAGRMLAGLSLVALAWWLVRQDEGRAGGFAGIAALTLGSLLLLSPVVMPWYLTWVLPLAVIAGQRTWLWFSALVCLSFLVMIDGQERAAPRVIEYGCLAAIGFHEWWTRRALRRGKPARIARLPRHTRSQEVIA